MRVDNYSELFDFDPSKHKYVLEASTGYTKYPSEKNVAKNIFNYGIAPKFIYVVRNPFHRIESHYNYMQRKSGWNLEINDRHLLKTSNYYIQLKQYLEYFPLSQFLVVDFDDLCCSPDTVMTQVYDFLNISDGFRPKNYVAHNATSVEPKLIKCAKFIQYLLPKKEKRKLSSAERNIIFSSLQLDMKRLYIEFGFDVKKWGFDID